MAATYLFCYLVEKTIDWRSRRRSIFARCIEGFLGLLMVFGSAGVAGSSYYVTKYNHGDDNRVDIAIATTAMTVLYTICTIFRKNRNPFLNLLSADGTALRIPLKKRDDVVEEGRDDHYIFTGEDNSYIALRRRLDQLEKELINRDRDLDMWRSRAENVEKENTELKSWLQEQLHSFHTVQKGKGKAVRIQDPSTSKTADSSDDEDDGVH